MILNGRQTSVCLSVMAMADIYVDRTLFTSSSGLEHAKALVASYKQGKVQTMTPELWQAKKIVDSTLHPGQNLNYGHLVKTRHR